MIYLVEGVDCAGKSTFSKKLAENLGAEYQHYSKPDKDPSDYFFPALSAHLDGKTVVCDRHALGEMIYAKVKKEKSQWKDGAYEAMLQQLNDQHATLIVVWEYIRTLKPRFVEKNEQYITIKQGGRVQAAFLKEAKRIADEYPGIMVFTYKPVGNLWRLLSPRV